MCDRTDPYGTYRAALVEAGHLIPSAVPGVYGRSGTFEHVIEQFERLVTARGRHLAPEVMRFPPILPRVDYERINHIHNFPDLLGSIHTFLGDGKAHRQLVRKFEARHTGADWTEDLDPAAVMMIPAACYPLYPTATGQLPEEGRVVDLRSYVFRHEPSGDPARMQIFRQREYVRLGTAAQALAHRDDWLERGGELLRAVGLPVERVIANDPFFGRGGRLAKATQREQALKWELVVPIASETAPTAVSSSNYHLDAFGVAFDIIGPDGQPAHTACVGFGLERIALALFRHHGFDPDRWPGEVRQLLDL